MVEADSNAMDLKRDLLDQRMKERHQQREMEISRCLENSCTLRAIKPRSCIKRLRRMQIITANYFTSSEMSAHRKRVLKNWCLFSTKI